MATTTNYSWTTPDDTDLVSQGASAIRTLGTAIDSTVFTNAGNAINKTIIDAAGDLIYGTAADTAASLAIGTAGQVLTVNSGSTAPEWATPASASPASAGATVATSQNTTSSTYTDLATAGPEVTITTGTKALVIVTSRLSIGGIDNCFMSYAVSGSTTIAASDTVALAWTNDANHWLRMSAVSRLSTLTAGSNTFTAKYRTVSGTATFVNREITVIDLGS